MGLRLRLVPFALVTVLLAVACGTGPQPTAGAGPADRSVTSTAAAPPEPPTTYLSIRPAPCPFPAGAAHGLTVQCSEMIVPMDRRHPAGGTVTVSVARVKSPAPDARPDPVVYLEGGPGGSAISSIDFWTSPAAPFLDHRDLILVDQRGTGYSKPRLTCDDFGDDVYGAAAVRYTEDCVHILHNAGIDLSAFDTTESAADLYDLRKAMGIGEWNLFGISYGTRLALWTLHTRPQGIRSIIIDSVYPPGVALTDTVATSFLRALRAIAADCAAQAPCAAAHPDLEGELARAVERADAAGGDGDDFARYLFQSMYATSVEPVVPKAIGLAAAGDVSGAAGVLRAARTGLAEDSSPGIASRPHMSEALYQSVECAESAAGTTPSAIRRAAQDLPASLAKPFVDNDLRLYAVCNVWKVEPNPLEPVRSDVPALVMAGSYDPITPPEWAQKAASTLSRAQYQLVQGSGHGTWLAGDCPKQKVSAFLEDPTAPGPDCPGSVPAFVR